MEILLSSNCQPFAVAGLVMTCLVLIEIVSLIAGFSLSHVLDQGLEMEANSGHHADPSDTGLLGGALGWVNAGRVPALVFIIIWLAAFAIAGFVIQTIAAAIWTLLPALPASLMAFFLATPATRLTTRWVSFIIPRDETYVISDDDLVGRVAEVTLGPLDQGAAGRIKLQDIHGNWHFPLARAANDQASIPVGAQVLLVDRAGPTFLAILAPEELKSIR
jgi:hypothetical protein